MKKFIFFLSLFVSVANLNAQDNNIETSASLELVVDSLSEKLNKLQHEYDFLYCSHELALLNLEIKAEIDNVDIKSNAILINCYHSRFNIDLYTAYRDNYNTSLELFNSIESKVSLVKASVALKILSSNFTKTDIDVLVKGTELLDKCLLKLESSLNYYKVVLNVYKDL